MTTKERTIVENLAWDESTVDDWYLHSIANDSESHVWTEEHIHELCKDFYLIPKQ